MKYYVRQIKPFIKLPFPGADTGYAVDGYDWVPEDMEEDLRKTITLDPFWAVLTFKERFVEVQDDTILQN